VIAGIWLASLVLWLATWGAVHWSWGYAICTFGLGFFITWFQRPLSSSQFGFMAPLLIMIVGNKVSSSVFYPGDYPVAAGLHQSATFGLLLVPGLALAHWLRRKRAGDMESIEPPPVVRDRQVT
jgi:hypothetical protein